MSSANTVSSTFLVAIGIKLKCFLRPFTDVLDISTRKLSVVKEELGSSVLESVVNRLDHFSSGLSHIFNTFTSGITIEVSEETFNELPVHLDLRYFFLFEVLINGVSVINGSSGVVV